MFWKRKHPPLVPGPISEEIFADTNLLSPNTEEGLRLKREAHEALTDGYSRIKEYLMENMDQEQPPIMKDLYDFLILNRPL